MARLRGFFTTGNCSRSNRISPICFGELGLNGWPASWCAFCSSSSILRPSSWLCCCSLALSISTPWRSILEQHFAAGHFDLTVDEIQPGSAASCGYSVWCSCRRDVRILGAVLAGGLQFRLRRNRSVYAPAADLFVMDRRQPEMALRQIVHVMRLVAFQHVRLQQGVVGNAGQRNAVVGEHMLVVFEILAHLELAGFSSHGLSFGQRKIQIQLRRCAGIAVRQRQVGGLVRPPR